MTIFSSIKYPISCPPTKEQLDNLPKDLYELWLTVTLNIKPHETFRDTNTMSHAIREYYNKSENKETIEKAVNRLRNAIYTLDE